MRKILMTAAFGTLAIAGAAAPAAAEVSAAGTCSVNVSAVQGTGAKVSARAGVRCTAAPSERTLVTSTIQVKDASGAWSTIRPVVNQYNGTFDASISLFDDCLPGTNTYRATVLTNSGGTPGGGHGPESVITC